VYRGGGDASPFLCAKSAVNSVNARKLLMSMTFARRTAFWRPTIPFARTEWLGITISGPAVPGCRMKLRLFWSPAVASGMPGMRHPVDSTGISDGQWDGRVRMAVTLSSAC